MSSNSSEPTSAVGELAAQAVSTPAVDNHDAAIRSSTTTFPTSKIDATVLSKIDAAVPVPDEQLAERLAAIPLVEKAHQALISKLNGDAESVDAEVAFLTLLNAISLLFVAFELGGAHDVEAVCWIRAEPSDQKQSNNYSVLGELSTMVAELRRQLPLDISPLLGDVLVEQFPTLDSAGTTPGARHEDPHYSRQASLAQSLGDLDLEQFADLMLDLRRHRPDQVVVHGFSLQDQQVVLGSANACGFWNDAACPADDLEVWVRHVCGVYHSLAHDRVPGLRLHGVVDNVPVYRLAVPERADSTRMEDIFVAPLFTRRPPGRTTFVGTILDVKDSDPNTAALRTAYNTRECTGVVKIAWPRAKDHKSEVEWYAAAHRDGWIPGLARHRAASAEHVHVFNPVAEDDARVLDVTILDSVGVPLSQCETPRELLEAISAVTLSEWVFLHGAGKHSQELAFSGGTDGGCGRDASRLLSNEHSVSSPARSMVYRFRSHCGDRISNLRILPGRRSRLRLKHGRSAAAGGRHQSCGAGGKYGIL